jgi:hypothetical protein
MLRYLSTVMLVLTTSAWASELPTVTVSKAADGVGISEVQGDIFTTPSDGKLQAAVWINGADLALGISEDGGKRWRVHALAVSPVMLRDSRPKVAIDLRGWIHILFAVESGNSGWSHVDGGILALTTEDKGKSFRRVVQVAYDSTNGIHFAPRVACDVDPQSPYHNHVYVVWIAEFTRTDGSKTSQIMFTKSRNGGLSYYVSRPDAQDGGANFWLPSLRISTGLDRVYDPAVSVEGPQDLRVSWEVSGPVCLTSPNGGISFASCR